MVIDCQTFLQRYSEYRDDRLAPPERGAFAAHLTVCRRCARYDRVVDGGVRVFRDLEPLSPAGDLGARVRSALDRASVPAGAPSAPANLPTAALAAIAASILLVAWLPAMRPAPAPRIVLPPVAAHAPHPRPAIPAYLTAPVFTAPRSESPFVLASTPLSRVPNAVLQAVDAAAAASDPR